MRSTEKIVYGGEYLESEDHVGIRWPSLEEATVALVSRGFQPGQLSDKPTPGSEKVSQSEYSVSCRRNVPQTRYFTRAKLTNVFYRIVGGIVQDRMVLKPSEVVKGAWYCVQAL